MYIVLYVWKQIYRLYYQTGNLPWPGVYIFVMLIVLAKSSFLERVSQFIFIPEML